MVIADSGIPIVTKKTIDSYVDFSDPLMDVSSSMEKKVRKQDELFSRFVDTLIAKYPCESKDSIRATLFPMYFLFDREIKSSLDAAVNMSDKMTRQIFYILQQQTDFFGFPGLKPETITEYTAQMRKHSDDVGAFYLSIKAKFLRENPALYHFMQQVSNSSSLDDNFNVCPSTKNLKDISVLSTYWVLSKELEKLRMRANPSDQNYNPSLKLLFDAINHA